MPVQATPAPLKGTSAPVAMFARSPNPFAMKMPQTFHEGEGMGGGGGDGGAQTAATTTAATTTADGAQATTTQAAQADGAAAQTATTGGSWRDAIADEALKKHAERFASPTDLAKAHLELRQKLSTAIVPPGEGATEEEVKAYRAKIGIPEAPEGYEFKTFDDREPSEADKAFHGMMGKAMLDAGISKDAAAKLNAAYNEFGKQVTEAQAAADKKFAEESQEALRKEWGADYDRNKVFAERAGKELMGADFEAARQIETKDGKFVLDHPIMLKMLATIGREMGEDRIGPTLSGTDRGTVEEQIRELRGKRNAAMGRNDHKTAGEIEKQMQGLYTKLEGRTPVVGTGGRAA